MHWCLHGKAPKYYLVDRCTPVSDVVGRLACVPPVGITTSAHHTRPSSLRCDGTRYQTTSELSRTMTVFAGF